MSGKGSQERNCWEEVKENAQVLETGGKDAACTLRQLVERQRAPAEGFGTLDKEKGALYPEEPFINICYSTIILCYRWFAC